MKTNNANAMYMQSAKVGKETVNMMSSQHVCLRRNFIFDIFFFSLYDLLNELFHCIPSISFKKLQEILRN